MERFDGITFDQKKDGSRLSTLFHRVKDLMLDGSWRTIQEIQSSVGGTEASVSARLRDLRKPKFGRHIVERQSRGDRSRGLFEYRVVGLSQKSRGLLSSPS